MDLERVKEEAIYSCSWENINIPIMRNRKPINICVPLILTGENGIYVFTNTQERTKELYNELNRLFSLRDEIFIFVSENDHDYLYNPADNGLIQLRNGTAGFGTFYGNHLIPTSRCSELKIKTIEDYLNPDITPDKNENQGYIKPLITEMRVEIIEKKLHEMEEAPTVNGNTRVYSDGTMEVKKTVSTGGRLFGGYSGTREIYYPCFDEDGNKNFLITVFGGWFGLHKFRHGKIAGGILYALTGGVIGVFYLFDVLMTAIGNYYEKSHEYSFTRHESNIEKLTMRRYTRPIENKLLLLLLPVALAIAIGVNTYIYKPLLNAAVSATQVISENIVKANANQLADEYQIEFNEGE